MSNFNFMDRVPVKIAESFKPPPRIYQLPQAIVHKLQLPSNHYNDSPQYGYDFQLERKVLAKMSEWRRMRQLEREARRERKERREQERLHEVEAKNKQMLGAVSYPSADDLSDSDSDSEDQKGNKQMNVINTTNSPKVELVSALPTQINSFHNILQPTIVSIKDEKHQLSSGIVIEGFQSRPKKEECSGVSKEVNAFNYKDFEEDTSSPFDNIELKTINDLDILAQVLHNTQLHAQKNQIKDESNEKPLGGEAKENEVDSIKSQLESKENAHSTDIGNITSNSVENLRKVDLKNFQDPKGAPQRVSLENYGKHSWCDLNIPNAIITNNNITNNSTFIGNNCNIPTCTSFASLNQQPSTQQQSYALAYGTLYNSHAEHQLPQQYTNFNVHTTQCTPEATHGSHSYLYAPTYNGITSAYCSPRPMQQHISNVNSTYLNSGADNYGDARSLSNGIQLQQQLQPTNDYHEVNLKSKSVPDILKELSEEVRNSEIRRSRYYSFNSEEGKQNDEKPYVDEDITPKQSPVKKLPKPSQEKNYYGELPPSAQRLVKNISSMGFPLQRVAKISQIFGTNDKKIVEHLIPLSELMDLGFDEAKISDALIKFDNNKEKALEYLIS